MSSGAPPRTPPTRGRGRQAEGVWSSPEPPRGPSAPVARSVERARSVRVKHDTVDKITAISRSAPNHRPPLPTRPLSDPCAPPKIVSVSSRIPGRGTHDLPGGEEAERRRTTGEEQRGQAHGHRRRAAAARAPLYAAHERALLARRRLGDREATHHDDDQTREHQHPGREPPRPQGGRARAAPVGPNRPPGQNRHRQRQQDRHDEPAGPRIGSSAGGDDERGQDEDDRLHGDPLCEP